MCKLYGLFVHLFTCYSLRLHVAQLAELDRKDEFIVQSDLLKALVDLIEKTVSAALPYVKLYDSTYYQSK